MVKICDNEYPADNEEKYKEYFRLFPHQLSAFQKHSIEAIVEGNHCLVTAHTGSGKTLPAEFAIQHFVGKGKKVIYCSPIKALSNQKKYEFTQKYPHISFGLYTGDIKTNPEADVLIMTTEILMNYLFIHTSQQQASITSPTSPTPINPNEEREGSSKGTVGSLENLVSLQREGSSKGTVGSLDFNINIETELAAVIFDEVHYINDRERGQVWEKTMMLLPPKVQLVMLSATIDNPQGFAEWIETKRLGLTYLTKNDKTVYLSSTTMRVVPLTEYCFLTTTEAIFKGLKDKVLEKEIRDNTNILLTLQHSNGKFEEKTVQTVSKMLKTFETRQVYMKRPNVLNNLAQHLVEREMLPAIAFVFSRKQVEICAKEITTNLLDFDSKIPYTVRRECEQIVRKLPNHKEYFELPEYCQLVSLLEKGIGIHHSGMIPVLREIVELMISKKYIKLLFATESFAIGLDCPIRTAIFTSLTKFDGNGERYLHAHEYSQMKGRAGRRGIDTAGHVIHLNNLFKLPVMSEYKTILSGKPQQLISKFHISYALILNLLKNGQKTDFHAFSEKSMIYTELIKSINAQEKYITELTEKAKTKRGFIDQLKTPYATCVKVISIEGQLKTLTNKKKKDAERELRAIQDDYRSLNDDLKQAKEFMKVNGEIDGETINLKYMRSFVTDQTNTVCQVLVDDGFIAIDNAGKYERNTTEYELTQMGLIAANVAEIHPLIISKMLTKYDYFSELSVKQLIGIFSCFTDIKVPPDIKASVPQTDDDTVKLFVKEINEYCLYFEKREMENDMRTGIRYDDLLNYDMIDFAMEWCDCTNEYDCKYFIQNKVAEKSISVGDFNKALLKIVTIAKELANVCEIIGQIELKYKLSQIEGFVLKYVTTSQSLYL